MTGWRRRVLVIGVLAIGHFALTSASFLRVIDEAGWGLAEECGYHSVNSPLHPSRQCWELQGRLECAAVLPWSTTEECQRQPAGIMSIAVTAATLYGLGTLAKWLPVSASMSNMIAWHAIVSASWAVLVYGVWSGIRAIRRRRGDP